MYTKSHSVEQQLAAHIIMQQQQQTKLMPGVQPGSRLHGNPSQLDCMACRGSCTGTPRSIEQCSHSLTSTSSVAAHSSMACRLRGAHGGCCLVPVCEQIPFWRCSVGVCADARADDVGFIDTVMLDMPRRLRTVKAGQVGRPLRLLQLRLHPVNLYVFC